MKKLGPYELGPNDQNQGIYNGDARARVAQTNPPLFITSSLQLELPGGKHDVVQMPSLPSNN